MITSRFPKRWRSRLDSRYADLIAIALIVIDVAVLMTLTFLFLQGALRIESPLYLS